MSDMHADKWFQQLMIFEGIDVTSEPTCFNDSFYWQLIKMKLYEQKHFHIFLLIITWKRYPENRIEPKMNLNLYLVYRMSTWWRTDMKYNVNGLVLCKPSWADSEKSKRWINDFIMLKMNPNLELLRQSSIVRYEFYFGRYCTLSNYTGNK